MLHLPQPHFLAAAPPSFGHRPHIAAAVLPHSMPALPSVDLLALAVIQPDLCRNRVCPVLSNPPHPSFSQQVDPGLFHWHLEFVLHRQCDSVQFVAEPVVKQERITSPVGLCSPASLTALFGEIVHLLRFLCYLHSNTAKQRLHQ